MELYDVNPTKLNLKLEIKDLQRQIIVTVTANDDEAFSAIAAFADDFEDIWKHELEQYKAAKHP